MGDISRKKSDLQALCGLLFNEIVHEDKKFLLVGIIYAIVISMLILAVPVSVQLLVSSVTHTASINAVMTLTVVLFLVLAISGGLIAMQSYVMERFERRFYARITAEFTLRLLYADRKYFNTINRYELVNRYFDVTQVQKILPNMVVGLFTLILQTIVGCAVVATFHPILMVFVAIFLLLLMLCWRIWGYRAIYSAIKLSEAKYEMARHLEDVARANDYFKSANHGIYAIDRSNSLTKNYIGKRITHFHHVFSQQIGLLVLYVVSNAALLGVGGNLVIIGELGLGQLIAAELILSAVFYGISRLVYHMSELYGLVAALEEIYRVIDIPTEITDGRYVLDPHVPVGLRFNKVAVQSDYGDFNLHFEVFPSDKLLIRSESYELQGIFFDVIKRYIDFAEGEVTVGKYPIQDLKQRALRDDIMILDRPTIIEASVIDYLRADAPDADFMALNEVLEMVELQTVIDRLPEKENTMLGINGTPLTISETLRLKLAAALIAKPHILILNEFFDVMSVKRRKRIMKRICDIEGLTLLYFSQQLDVSCFSRYMFLDESGKREVPTIAELYVGEEGGGP